MQYKLGESMEDWAKRVQMYEQGAAMQRIAKGDDVELVMNDMARRITEKMLYPVLKSLRDTVDLDPAKVEADRKAYYENMSKYGPKADHVLDDD